MIPADWKKMFEKKYILRKILGMAIAQTRIIEFEQKFAK